MQTRLPYSSITLLLFSVLLFHCANPVTPEGGAKDISPPEVSGCEPPNYSTNFSSPDIHITFNEFVSLKASGSDVFISPPLTEKPDYKLRGKTVVVDFTDTLASNTTYIINFGKSITDITEGNVLANFLYVFSTGDYIDSLTISGKVITAFDNKPAKLVFAGLYRDTHDTIPFDSLPYLRPPLYLTQTDEQGMFTFQNLRTGKYKLIILDDKSGDFIYNMPAEKIAFADSLITPWSAPLEIPDSIRPDSTVAEDQPRHPQLLLKLFEEVDSTQEVTKSELLSNNLFRIIYKYPPVAPEIFPLNIDTSFGWCMEEFSRRKDTILLFTMVELPDTLILEIRDEQTVLDTVTISPTRIHDEKRSRKKGEKEKPETLPCTWKPSGIFNYLKNPMSGSLPYPVSEYDFSGIRLITGRDTIIPSVEFMDPLMRMFRVTSSWKEATMYRLLIPDSSFISYNGLANDTTLHAFQTVTLKDLGSLVINITITERPGNYIIQLMTDKEKVVEEAYTGESGPIKFAFIAPATYTIKAILDSNGNHRWDTGDYLNKSQPETVFFFPKAIEIRGNWDVEEEWKL